MALEDPRSFSNFDSMCGSPNVEYFLLESKMRSVTNMSVAMANLVNHTNLLSKGGAMLGYRSSEYFLKGEGGTRSRKSRCRVHGGNGGLRILLCCDFMGFFVSYYIS